MGWNWTANTGSSKTVRNARGSFRGTFSFARSPLPSTYLNLHPRINTDYLLHSESERIAFDYHAFDIDLWHGCDIVVTRTPVIDSREFSEPMIQYQNRRRIFCTCSIVAFGNFYQFSVLVRLTGANRIYLLSVYNKCVINFNIHLYHKNQNKCYSCMPC